MIWQGVTHGQTIGIKDEYMKLQVQIKNDKPTRFWRFPLLTVSNSEDGFEKGHQGVIITPNWQVAIEPKETWTVKIIHEVKRI
jgi:alpha-amylase